MKGLVKSHCLSKSPGTHCTTDYVTLDEFSLSLLSSFPILLVCLVVTTFLTPFSAGMKHRHFDPPTGHLYHCSSVVKTRSKIKPKLNVRSVSLYYVRLCIICYYMLLLFFKSGIDYSVKTLTLDNMQVAMQLWDTAGQER